MSGTIPQFQAILTAVDKITPILEQVGANFDKLTPHIEKVPDALKAIERNTAFTKVVDGINLAIKAIQGFGESIGGLIGPIGEALPGLEELWKGASVDARSTGIAGVARVNTGPAFATMGATP